MNVMCSYSNSCSIPNGLSVILSGNIEGAHTSSPYQSLLRTMILNKFRYKSPPVKLVDCAKLYIVEADMAAACLFFFRSVASIVLWSIINPKYLNYPFGAGLIYWFWYMKL